jgi:hypothetical protein
MSKFYKKFTKKSTGLKKSLITEGSEASIQQSICRYLDITHPRILYCASAGGMRTSMKQAIKMKLTGYKKGFPDMFIYKANDSFKGLAIEVKKKGGVISPHQKEWLSRLKEGGYFSCVVYNLDDAIQIIESYISNTIQLSE